MKTNLSEVALTIALPKGRLQKKAEELFGENNIDFEFEARKLVASNEEYNLKFLLVKNSDLPTYVSHGIAGLGICGDDVIYESGEEFYKLMTFDFGGTDICIAAKEGEALASDIKHLKVATKFTNYTRDYFNNKGISVQIIKLNGSVELAPILGLAPYIVDLVETGTTLKAHNLQVQEKIARTKVHLIANPGYYKLHYKRINNLINVLKGNSNE
jgi:ATP phosphoribosyltransferase